MEGLYLLPDLLQPGVKCRNEDLSTLNISCCTVPDIKFINQAQHCCLCPRPSGCFSSPSASPGRLSQSPIPSHAQTPSMIIAELKNHIKTISVPFK